MKIGRLDDFWSLANKPKLLPRETREYVPMILAAIVIARNPAQYGFEFEPDPPHQYEIVTLTRPIDLRKVAEWADTTIDQIQQLNPELRRWMTPAKDSAYELKVPVGAAAIINERMQVLGSESTASLASLNWYTVKSGETLAVIARKLRVSRADLADANYLRINSPLDAGQKLMVPQQSTTLMAARTDRPVPLAEARATTADKIVPEVASANTGRIKLVYEVRDGDTLSSIARLFQTTTATLRSWNRNIGSQIRVGERLTVYRFVRAN